VARIGGPTFGDILLNQYDAPMPQITWRVEELATQRGWGARRLAEETGLDQKTVRNILAGRATRVDLNTILRLSRALGVGPGSLWDLEPDPAWAWEKTAGSAGEARPGELDEVLTGHWSEQTDPALERALRSP
jgi:DNA-binding Xre family transcriptional regulator